MRMAVVALCLGLALSSCTNPNGTTNNQGTYGLIGAGGGAAAGGLLGNLVGRGSALGTVVGATAGGLLGYFAGSAIGAQLDERDRELAAASTNDVLDEPVAYVPPPGHSVTYRHPIVRHWTSDHTSNSGNSQLVKVSVNEGGNQCREVRQLAVISGQEVTQMVNYCQNTDGGWKPASA